MNVMRKSKSQYCQQKSVSQSPYLSPQSPVSVPHSPLPTPRYSLFIVLCSLFIVFSCKTAPKAPDAALMETGVPLDAGATVYIFADVKKARSIIDLLPLEELKDSQTRQLMDSTEFLVAALFPPESGRRFQLTAWGAYPSGRANMALSFNKSWKKQRSKKGDFWYSASNHLSIAIEAKQAFAASWLNTYDSPAAASVIAYPENFNEFRQGSPFSCWFDTPAPLINSVIKSSGIPLNLPAEKLFINLYPSAEKQYEALIRVQFESTTQARGMAAMLSIAGSFMSDDSSPSIMASLFFANPPVQNGHSLDIKPAVLSEAEIKQLLELFKVF